MSTRKERKKDPILDVVTMYILENLELAQRHNSMTLKQRVDFLCLSKNQLDFMCMVFEQKKPLKSQQEMCANIICYRWQMAKLPLRKSDVVAAGRAIK